MKALASRLGKLDTALHFTLTTPADVLDHPLRIAMMRAHFERIGRYADDGSRRLAAIVLGFSDALLVDFLFFNSENDALRGEGKDEDAVWEHAFPWWKVAYEREPDAVAPAFADWVRAGIVIETADGFMLATEDAT